MSEAEQVVNKTQTKKEEPQEREYEVRPKNTTKLQIRNLQFGTSKEDLHDLGRRFGTIVSCEVNKGNGFITYSKGDEAQLALSQLDALSFRGYTLRVQFAREPLPNKDKKPAEATPTTTTATTTTPTTTAGQKPEAKKEEKKLTFAQQQQLAKSKPQAPKQTFTQPAETPKVEQTQNNNNNQQGKGQQQQGQGKKKGQQQQNNKQQQQQQQQAESKKNELRSYKVSVEKTVLQEGDKKEEGFTFSVNHQQYLDYIIPLLKDIQSKKEQEKGSK